MAMIFRPDLAEKVLAGEKTVTRRRTSSNPNSPWFFRKCRYRVGGEYTVQPGRGQVAIGRIRIVSVGLEPLSAMRDGSGLCTNEAAREGFASFEAFREAWLEINGGWDPAAEVWRVQFELVRAG